MLLTIFSRLLQGVLVIFILFTITFLAIRALPGNPFTSDKEISERAMLELEKQYYLDKSLPIQYGLILKDYLRGDLKNSEKKQLPVKTVIAHSFPASAILGTAAMIIACMVGIPAGIIAALKKNSLIDYSTMLITLLGISIPSFVVGPLLAISASSVFPMLKVAGWGDPLDWILPSITLGLATAAYLARITRTGMLDVLNQDFIRTAKAKGLTPFTIIWKHALRGGILPAINYIGPAFAALISGSFVVETIFQLPGMGKHFVNATIERDYMLLQGVAIVFGILIVIVNIAADIALVLLNPRLRPSK